MHQPRHVGKAHVSGEKFLVIQHADAAMALDPVTVEREVHFLDAVALAQSPKRASAPGAPPLNRMQSAGLMGRDDSRSPLVDTATESAIIVAAFPPGLDDP